jgi:hypothetical protein
MEDGLVAGRDEAGEDLGGGLGEDFGGIVNQTAKGVVESTSWIVCCELCCFWPHVSWSRSGSVQSLRL